MSSDYKILCLSHDPAIVVGPEYGSSDQWRSPEPALAEIRDRTGHAAQHRDCHLLVGRYSSPLIEVCCPRTTKDGHYGYHPYEDKWIDADWLALLALSTSEQRGRVDDHCGCWLYETAHRLRYELGIVGTGGQS